MNSVELRQKRAALVEEVRTIQTKAAGRMLNSEERAKVTTIEQSMGEIEANIPIAERQERRSANLTAQPGNRVGGASDDGTDMDLSRYSLTRAISSQGNGHLDGYEAEVSQELSRRSGRAPSGFYIPLAVLAGRENRAALAVGNTGSEFRPINTATGSFIDALRPSLSVVRLGATVLTGLVGDFSIPRQTSASVGAWKTENAAMDEQSQVFDQLRLSPKRVGAYSQISKQLLVQSDGSIDALVRADLMAAIAQSIDIAAISGDGTGNAPTGILSAAGLNLYSIGTNGGAITYAHLLAMQKALADSNADTATIKWLTNASVRAKLAGTIYDAGSGLTHWDKAQGLGSFTMSNNVPKTLVKGTSGAACSAVIYGDFSQVIIGSFGQSADVVVDPYTLAREGITRIVVTTLVDVGVRRGANFAAIKDATTT
jgi:HK97 family phage major capsid protein